MAQKLLSRPLPGQERDAARGRGRMGVQFRAYWRVCAEGVQSGGRIASSRAHGAKVRMPNPRTEASLCPADSRSMMKNCWPV